MVTLTIPIADVLCWTIFAPIVRNHRLKKQTRLVTDHYHRERIDELLSEIIKLYGDLLR